jgi:hypothetical protein
VKGYPNVYFLDTLSGIRNEKIEILPAGQDMKKVLGMDLLGPSLADVYDYCEKHKIGPYNTMAFENVPL